MSIWYTSKVFEGTHDGKKIGFPTVNLSSHILHSSQKQGVYASYVKYKNVLYKGALFFGQRLVKNETDVVLEIYILNFNQEIYGKTIEFTIDRFIRPPLSFTSMEHLKLQIKKDIEQVQNSKKHTVGII